MDSSSNETEFGSALDNLSFTSTGSFKYCMCGSYNTSLSTLTDIANLDDTLKSDTSCISSSTLKSALNDDNISTISIDSLTAQNSPLLSETTSPKKIHVPDEIIVISSDDENGDVVVEIDESTSTSETYTTDEAQSIKIYRSIEEFDRNLPTTVTLLTSPNGSKVYVVGTAHFSEKSQNDVSTVIRNVQPDIVVIELCPARIHILQHDEKTLLEEAADINMTKIRSIIETSGMVNGLFYVLLLKMSAQITKELGMAPGGEFRRAVEEAKLLPKCTIHLGDRPINITIQRALHGLSFWQSLKLIWRLMTSNETISKEEVERCKEKDLLEELMKEMTGEYPAFGNVVLNERDTYLCHSLQVATNPDPRLVIEPNRPLNVVGVVGIGHVSGIKQLWGKVDSSQIPNICIIPPASRSNRIAKATIKYGTMALLCYGMFRIYRVARPKILTFF